MADLTQQLQIQQDINKALAEREKLLNKNIALMSKQAEISKGICDALDCKGLKGMEKDARGAKTALSEVASSAENAGNTLENAMKKGADAAEDTADSLNKTKKAAAALAALSGALSGFKTGVSLVGGAVKGLFKGLTGIISVAFRVTKSLLSLPFKIISGLLNMAQGGGVDPFRVALEELRKELGNFRESGPAKDIAKSVYTMRKAFNNGSTSAVSFARVFGYGREGLAAGLKFSMEMAKGVGPIFDTMSAEFEKNAGKLAKYSKGLGMTGEQMGGIIAKSKAAGKDYMKTFDNIGNLSLQLGKKFNVSVKSIGRTVGDMMNDIEHFGDMTEKQMVETAVQTKRLGIEIKTLQGIVDKFDNFEDAAKSAAMLRRQFGLMIDARKMMSMTGAERVDYMQQQFKRTGRSFETMGRIEKKAFAATLGMGAKEAQMMFGKKSLQKDMNKVKSAGDKADKKKLSTARVLLKLTKQIERVFGSGGSKYKSFFAAFVGGFQKGIYWSTEFRQVMMNMRRSLRIVERAGRRVGRSFVKFFPGIKQMLRGIARFFEPGNVSRNMRKVTTAFENFFKALHNPRGVRSALDNLYKDFVKIFKEFFGGRGKAGKDIMEGFQVFGTIVGVLKLELIDKSLGLAADFLNTMADAIDSYLQGKRPFKGVGDKMGKGFQDRFGESFSKIGDTLEEKFFPALKKFVPKLIEGVQYLFAQMRDYLNNNPEAMKKLVESLGESFAFLLKLKMKVLKYAFTEHTGLMMGMMAVPMGLALGKGMLMGLGTLGAGFFAKGMSRMWRGKPFLKATKGPGFMKGMANLARGMGGALLKFGGFIFRPLRLLKGARGLTALRASGAARALAGIGTRMGGMIGGGAAAGVAAKMGGKALLRYALGPISMGIAGLFGGISRSFDRLTSAKDNSNPGWAFLTGFADFVTFGLMDQDYMEDLITGSKRYSKRLADEFAANTADLYEKAYKVVDPMRQKTKQALDRLLQDFKDTNIALHGVNQSIGKDLSSNSQAALKSLTDMMNKQEKIVEKQKAEADRYGRLAISAGVVGPEMLARYYKDAGSVFKSDMNIGLSEHKEMGQALFDELNALNERMGTEYALEFRDGVLTVDDDFVQKLGTETSEIFAKVGDPSKYTEMMNKVTENAATQANQLYNSMDLAALTTLKREVLEKGNEDDPQVQKVLTDISTGIDTKIRLNAMRDALIKAGYSGKSMDKQNIEQVFEKVYMKKLGSTDAQNKVRAEVQQAITAATAEVEEKARPLSKKLEKLQATNQTLKQIQELSGIPAQLKAAKAKFDKMPIEKLKKDVASLLVKVLDLSDHIMGVVKEKGLDKKQHVMNATVMENLQAIGVIRETIDKVTAKGTVGEETLKIRTTNILRAVRAAGDIASGMQLTSDGNKSPLLKPIPTQIISSISSLATAGDLIYGSGGVLTAVPKNLTSKITAAHKGIKAVSKMVSDLKKDHNLQTAVSLGRELSAGKNISVEVKKTQINLRVQVNLEAKQLVRQLVKVDLDSGAGVNKLATTNYVKAATKV